MKYESILYLSSLRKKKKEPLQDFCYKSYIAGLNLTELLSEIVAFQMEKTQVGKLSRELIDRGQILFGAIERRVECMDLRQFAQLYQRHLHLERENQGI